MSKIRVKNIIFTWVILVCMIASTCLTSFASTSMIENKSDFDLLTSVPEDFKYIYGKAGDLYSIYTYSVNGVQYKVIDTA